ncbi:hypothetical protein Ahy_B08g090089 [Arachis hypogaea]|uniref:Uncharacterized protein n=1 Tax=Arachis hypogaea TaxID=3818 RepID=A0A444XZG8_ARAHY|nr:hypothetical protein Ahy_B08g090089 [Arachis hypogaea]
MEKLFYKIFISILRDFMKYDSFFFDVRTHEPFGDMVTSSGESNRNPQFVILLGASNSMLVVVSIFVAAIAWKQC